MLRKRTYTGLIKQLGRQEIFVFGSNTQGRHGAGAAKWALDNAGAVYGQAHGPQGKSYAIVTKDLTKDTHPSVPMVMIIAQIVNLYDYAAWRSTLDFMVGYSGKGQFLSGYTADELASFFAEAGKQYGEIPNNIVFEDDFNKLVLKHYNK